MVDIGLNTYIFDFIFQDIVKYMTDITDYPQNMVQETILSLIMSSTRFSFGTTEIGDFLKVVIVVIIQV